MFISNTEYLSSQFKNWLSGYARLPKSTWHGISISFFVAILAGISHFLSLYLTNEKNFSVAESGLFMGLFGFGTICGGYVGGKLSDYYSAAKISVYGLVLQGTAFYFLTLVKTKILIMLILFLLGLGAYSFITANYLYVLNTCAHDESFRIKAINLLSVAYNFGFGISAIIISFFAVYGFTPLFIGATFSLYFIAFYCGFFSTHTIPPSSSKDKQEPKTAVSFLKIKNISDIKLVYALLLCVFIGGMIMSQMNSTYPLYIQEILPDFYVSALSTLFAINTFMVVFLQTPIIDATNKINTLRLIFLGMLFLGGGMALLCINTTFSIAIFAFVIHTIGEILVFSLTQLICYEKVHPHHKGHILGIYRMVLASSRMIGPVIGAFIYQYWGGQILWSLCFLIGTFICIPLYACKKY